MKLAYRREIDGLRAIAVISVVLFHAGVMPWSAGYVGVDVFFVISGYLITALLLREQADSGSVDMVSFYARRIRRIFPAVAVLMLGVLGAGVLLLDFRQLASLTESAIASTFFVANLHFRDSAGGYFSDVAESMPLLHLWSLSVEEQFYLVWPLLIVALRRMKLGLAPAMVLLALASFAFSERLMANGGADAAFYLMPSRFWELAVGGLVATISATKKLPRWLLPLGILILVDAILVPIVHFPGYGAAPAVAGTAIVLTAIHTGATNRWLSSRVAVGIGLISYPLYLWHWPLLAYYQVSVGYEGTAKVRLLLCGLAVVLAIGSYRYVEQPLRRRGSNRAVLSFGLGAFAAVALAAFAIGLKESKTPEAIAARDWPANKAQCHNLQTPRDECASGPGPVSIALWGDSMAFAWQPLAWQMASERDTAAIDYSMDGCKPAVGYVHRARAHCVAWNAKVLARVKEMDTVILVGRWGWEFFEIDRAKAEEGMRATLDSLRDVRRVILLGPTPYLRSDAFKCLQGNDLARCAVTEREFRLNSEPDRKSLLALADAYPNVEYVEPADWFCRDGLCPATRDGMILYYDHFHVSSSAVKAFAASFDAPAAGFQGSID